MTTQKPAAGRLPLRAARTAFLALLLVGLPLAAQSRSSHGASGGGGRTAQPSGGSHSSGPSMRGSAPPSRGGSSSGPSYDSGQSAGSGGRTAHEVPGGSAPHRQPSGNDHRGGHGGGWHGGHGYGGYGGYGGYYYPGWSWGFYPGFSWWWWDEPYDPYYYPSYRHYPYGYGYDGYGYSRNQTGALDLDVSPGRTHVFIDGEDLGAVDRYDGWPGYLWLPRGTYDVAFYLDGFKTVSRQITIYPGTVIDIDDRMEQGTSVRPQDLATKSHERRDDRLRYERQRRDDLDRQGYRDDDDQEWRDRVRRDRDRDRSDDMKGDRRDDDGSAVRDDRGSLRLDVDPDDASVYLDGRFIGTGSDLSMMQGGLSVAPGEHRLAIVRPGHKAEEQEFRVQAGQEIKLNIRLEDDSR
jgi:hypothetical protein